MDRGLVSRAPGGDGRWVAVYAHRDRLLRLARSRVGDVHDAEDCVSEAMLRCVEFEALDEERLGQFLTTVTLRLCADVHRRHARGDRLSRRLSAFSSVEPGPEESVCDRAESVWLTGRLAELPPKQREIVAARAEGLSCAAVAERFVMSYGAIESALARVRRSMRVTLESTLGVAAVPARRWLQLAGEVATAGAVVLGGVHGTAVATATPPVAPVAATRAADPAAPPAQPPGGAAWHDTPGAVPAAPTRTGALRVGVTAAPSRHWQRPEQDPTLGLDSGDRRYAGVGTDEHDYSKVERWQHCVRYGVAVGRDGGCRYPPGDPHNDDYDDNDINLIPGDL